MNALDRVRKRFGSLPAATDNTDRSLSVSSGSPSPEEERVLSPLPENLGRRIRSMAGRWRYSTTDLNEVLDLAREDPEKWVLAVALDERRQREFRKRGLLPSSDA